MLVFKGSSLDGIETPCLGLLMKNLATSAVLTTHR